MKSITLYEADDGSRWDTAKEANHRDRIVRRHMARVSRYDRLVARAIDDGAIDSPLRQREREQVFEGAKSYGLAHVRAERAEQLRAERKATKRSMVDDRRADCRASQGEGGEEPITNA